MQNNLLSTHHICAKQLIVHTHHSCAKQLIVHTSHLCKTTYCPHTTALQTTYCPQSTAMQNSLMSTYTHTHTHYNCANNLLLRFSISGSEPSVDSTRPLIQNVRTALFPRVKQSWCVCGHSVPPTSSAPCALKLWYLLSRGTILLHI
jgi:hypothetical protein